MIATCEAGHPWTDDTLYVHPSRGTWVCRECKQSRDCADYARARGRGIPRERDIACRKGHARLGYGYRDTRGVWHCRECKKVRRLPIRADELRRQRYGVMPEQYEILLARQENRCAICSEHVDSVGPLQVDHDHTTGSVRGLLCGRCNRALGLFKDRRDALMSAAAYLDRGGR